MGEKASRASSICNPTAAAKAGPPRAFMYEAACIQAAET